MEAYPAFLAIVAIAGFILGALLSFLTRMRIAMAVAWSTALLFVLGWIGWFSVELALLGVLIAALPSWAGATIGHRIKKSRS